MVEPVQKSEVREYWNEHPCGTQFTDQEWGTREFYDGVEQDRYRRQPFMREAVGFDRYPSRTLLEIGCGLGTDLLQFARGGAKVTGLDLTVRSVALAKRRFDLEETGGDFLTGDAETLPFQDDSFDVVYSFGVLHHTPDTRRAFREIHRVLRPGGEVVIMLYHSRSSHYYIGYPLAVLGRLARGRGLLSRDEYFRIYDGEDNPLGKAYTRRQVRDLFREFEIIGQRTYETWRPRLPHWANRVLISLGERFGFYLVTRARKPVS